MSIDARFAKLSLRAATIAAAIALFGVGASYAYPVSLGPHGPGPIVPVHGSPVLAKTPSLPIKGSAGATTGNIVANIIVRDHRTNVPGAYPYHCYRDCPGEGGLGYGRKPAQLPYGYQLTAQGGQVRDHRH